MRQHVLTGCSGAARARRRGPAPARKPGAQAGSRGRSTERACPQRAHLLHELPSSVDAGRAGGRLTRAHDANAGVEQRVDHASEGRRPPGDDEVGLAGLAKREHRLGRRLVANLDGARDLGDGGVGLSAKAAHGAAPGRALERAHERQLARAASDHAHRCHAEPSFLRRTHPHTFPGPKVRTPPLCFPQVTSRPQHGLPIAKHELGALPKRTAKILNAVSSVVVRGGQRTRRAG